MKMVIQDRLRKIYVNLFIWGFSNNVYFSKKKALSFKCNRDSYLSTEELYITNTNYKRLKLKFTKENNKENNK